MANHKSAKKRIRTNDRKREANKRDISQIKTLLKKTLNETDKTALEGLYKETVAVLDRCATKGRIHKNNAARKKSLITRHFNTVAKTA
ncbi:MAG TPA: 30S ribosomal protein S20 [Ignavibacteriales bacterium]|jgi:small subunit ribosomal protein S20|nr:30S ribosomal protein S20 [Ignavibacteriales bacterium]HEX3074407.1 30S ribosomal protein S20 [Ignavibacteriales bacterium]